jgi:CxxC motif-containing protein (DUF1111 family)
MNPAGLLLVFLFVSPAKGAPAATVAPDLSRQGGELTVRAAGHDAFSRPAPKAGRANRHAFIIGNSLFNENWVASPASVKTRQGLGPTFNAQSCSSCHFKDGRGAPPEKEGDPFVGLLLRLSLPGKGTNGEPLPVPRYGDQLQHRAIVGVPAEGRVVLTRTLVKGTYPDGTRYALEKPAYAFADLAFGPLPNDTRISPRVAPALHGMGLLEQIPESDIVAREDPTDADGDGISGRANRPWNLASGKRQVGRFGWKSNQPSVAQQNFSAFHGDIGITSPLARKQNCETGQDACAKAYALEAPEIDAESLKQVEIYTKILAVPAARNVGDPRFVEGLAAFRAAGCPSCHVESHVTSADAATQGFPELASQTIRAYTDLLLHDMGEDLADGREDFDADGREWRTPPLWGLGLVPVVNGHSRYLHDGRARSVEEAVLWHGGEATKARDAFKAFPRPTREALLFFLESL